MARGPVTRLRRSSPTRTAVLSVSQGTGRETPRGGDLKTGRRLAGGSGDRTLRLPHGPGISTAQGGGQASSGTPSVQDVWATLCTPRHDKGAVPSASDGLPFLFLIYLTERE